MVMAGDVRWCARILLTVYRRGQDRVGTSKFGAERLFSQIIMSAVTAVKYRPVG